MPPSLSRRHLLHSAAALAAFGGLGVHAARAAEALQLRAVRRNIEVRGKAAPVFGLTQPDGTSGVFLDPGQRFLVQLANQIGTDTIVHWHGQTPPAAQDGVAITGLEQVIAADAVQGYDFVPRAGTHWMHSHQGLQEMQLLAAPLIVRTAEDLRLDAQEVTVILHDFTFRTPDEVMASLGAGEMGGMKMGGGKPGDAKTGDMPGMKMAAGDSKMADMPNMKMGTTDDKMADMPDMKMGTTDDKMAAMPDMKMGTTDAKMPGMKMGTTDDKMAGMDMSGGEDLNDFDFDAYLANDRTLDDPQVVRTEKNGRVRLRLINGSSATAYWIDLGRLVGTVIAADGTPVQPVRGRRFPLAEAQRLDILVDVPAGEACPILAQRVGDTARTGIILAGPGATVRKVDAAAATKVGGLDNLLELQLSAVTPLPPRPVDRRYTMFLAGTMKPYSWSINGRSGWAEHEPLRVKRGERVVIDIISKSSMAHPMHLHGHSFQVIAMNGKPLNGAVRDTVDVQPWQSVSVAFDADNPGRWLVHCHILPHMETGMITEVAYES